MKYLKAFNESTTSINREKVIELMELCFIDLADVIRYSKTSYIITKGIFSIEYDFTNYIDDDRELRIKLYKLPPNGEQFGFVGFSIEEVRDSIEKMFALLDDCTFEYGVYDEDMEDVTQELSSLEIYITL